MDRWIPAPALVATSKPQNQLIRRHLRISTLLSVAILQWTQYISPFYGYFGPLSHFRRLGRSHAKPCSDNCTQTSAYEDSRSWQARVSWPWERALPSHVIVHNDHVYNGKAITQFWITEKYVLGICSPPTHLSVCRQVFLLFLIGIRPVG